MKKITIALLLIVLIQLAACERKYPVNGNAGVTTTEVTVTIASSTAEMLMTTTATVVQTSINSSTTTANISTVISTTKRTVENMDGVGQHRLAYYGVSIQFVELVGREAYFAWENTVCGSDGCDMLMLQFVQHFNITRKQFDEANEKLKQANIEWSGVLTSESDEIYNADIIYTFDAKLISDYYAWDKPPYFG